jgi:hypothetical protein
VQFVAGALDGVPVELCYINLSGNFRRTGAAFHFMTVAFWISY